MELKRRSEGAVKKDQFVEQRMNLPWQYSSYGYGEGVIEDKNGNKVASNKAFSEEGPNPLQMYEIVRVMNNNKKLTEMLDAYRNGERGMPTYEELAKFAYVGGAK